MLLVFFIHYLSSPLNRSVILASYMSPLKHPPVLPHTRLSTSLTIISARSSHYPCHCMLISPRQTYLYHHTFVFPSKTNHPTPDHPPSPLRFLPLFNLSVIWPLYFCLPHLILSKHHHHFNRVNAKNHADSHLSPLLLLKKSKFSFFSVHSQQLMSTSPCFPESSSFSSLNIFFQQQDAASGLKQYKYEKFPRVSYGRM